MTEDLDIRIATEGDMTMEELCSLYDAVGWTSYTADPDRLAAAIRGSSHVLAAHHDASWLAALARTSRPRTSTTRSPRASPTRATIPSGARYAATTGGGASGTDAA